MCADDTTVGCTFSEAPHICEWKDGLAMPLFETEPVREAVGNLRRLADRGQTFGTKRCVFATVSGASVLA
jgi:hypothetical protein